MKTFKTLLILSSIISSLSANCIDATISDGKFLVPSSMSSSLHCSQGEVNGYMFLYRDDMPSLLLVQYLFKDSVKNEASFATNQLPSFLKDPKLLSALSFAYKKSDKRVELEVNLISLGVSAMYSFDGVSLSLKKRHSNNSKNKKGR